MEEIWLNIDGYDGLYLVSNYGKVKSIRGCKLLKFDNSKGYFRVTLSKNGVIKRIQVHRLVASLFIENKQNAPCVNHIDGNKLNNRVDNLKWCTYSENEKHSHAILGKVPPMAKKCKNLITGEIFSSITKAAISIDIKPKTLLARLNGQNKNTKSIIVLL